MLPFLDEGGKLPTATRVFKECPAAAELECLSTAG